MRVSKKVRTIAADLCAATATECIRREAIVFLMENLGPFLEGEKLDMFHADQVAFVAAMAFRNAPVDSNELGYMMWAEQYVEAAMMLREGWSPPDDE